MNILELFGAVGGGCLSLIDVSWPHAFLSMQERDKSKATRSVFRMRASVLRPVSCSN